MGSRGPQRTAVASLQQLMPPKSQDCLRTPATDAAAWKAPAPANAVVGTALLSYKQRGHHDRAGPPPAVHLSNSVGTTTVLARPQR